MSQIRNKSFHWCRKLIWKIVAFCLFRKQLLQNNCVDTTNEPHYCLLCWMREIQINLSCETNCSDINYAVCETVVLKVEKNHRSFLESFAILKATVEIDIHSSIVGDPKITIVFPDSQDPKGNFIYNYLPITRTRFPFMVNIDLILTTNRSDIHLEEEWNKKLRDLFIDAFCAALSDKQFTKHHLCHRQGITFVPTQAHVSLSFFTTDFFRKLHSRLRITHCVRIIGGEMVCPPDVVFPKRLEKGFGQHARQQRNNAHDIKSTKESGHVLASISPDVNFLQLLTLLDLPKTVGKYLCADHEQLHSKNELRKVLGIEQWGIIKALDIIDDKQKHFAEKFEEKECCVHFFRLLLKVVRNAGKLDVVMRRKLWPVEGKPQLVQSSCLYLSGEDDETITEDALVDEVGIDKSNRYLLRKCFLDSLDAGERTYFGKLGAERRDNCVETPNQFAYDESNEQVQARINTLVAKRDDTLFWFILNQINKTTSVEGQIIKQDLALYKRHIWLPTMNRIGITRFRLAQDLYLPNSILCRDDANISVVEGMESCFLNTHQTDDDIMVTLSSVAFARSLFVSPEIIQKLLDHAGASCLIDSEFNGSIRQMFEFFGVATVIRVDDESNIPDVNILNYYLCGNRSEYIEGFDIVAFLHHMDLHWDIRLCPDAGRLKATLETAKIGSRFCVNTGPLYGKIPINQIFSLKVSNNMNGQCLPFFPHRLENSQLYKIFGIKVHAPNIGEIIDLLQQLKERMLVGVLRNMEMEALINIFSQLYLLLAQCIESQEKDLPLDVILTTDALIFVPSLAESIITENYAATSGWIPATTPGLHWSSQIKGSMTLSAYYPPKLMEFFTNRLGIPVEEAISDILDRTKRNIYEVHHLTNLVSKENLSEQHSVSDPLFQLLLRINNEENFKNYRLKQLIPLLSGVQEKHSTLEYGVPDWSALNDSNNSPIYVCDLPDWDVLAICEACGSDNILVADLSYEEVLKLPVMLQKCRKWSQYFECFFRNEPIEAAISDLEETQQSSLTRLPNVASLSTECIMQFLTKADVLKRFPHLKLVWKRDKPITRQEIWPQLVLPTQENQATFRQLCVEADLIFYPWFSVCVFDAFQSQDNVISRQCSEVHLFERNELVSIPRPKHARFSWRPISNHNIINAVDFQSEFCPYKPDDRILFLGEGRSMSFAAAVLRCFVEMLPSEKSIGQCLFSTTLNADEIKQSDLGLTNVRYLEKHGATVSHRPIDATDAKSINDFASKESYDFIVFNFPHTGAKQTSTGSKKGLVYSIQTNRDLLKNVFVTLKKLKCCGSHTRIHIAIKMVRPYTDWGLSYYAQENGFQLVRKFPFPKSFFETMGYEHETTLYRHLRGKVNLHSAEVHEFMLQGEHFS